MRSLAVVCIFGFISNSACLGQVVMLPTFNTFQYSGSVLVPDGGSVHLGSVRRAAQNSRSRGWGPLRQQSSSSSMSLGTVSANVRIIDLAEMDRQLLGAEPHEFLRNERAKQQASQAMQVPVDPVEQAKQLVRDARHCIDKGYLKAADYYYRRAIRELPSDLANLAQLEYQRFRETSLKAFSR